MATEHVQAAVLKKLADAVSYNVKELVKMEDGTPLALVAWHARNLLELYVWTEYCVQSSENTIRFAVDAIRDFDEIIQLLPQDAIDANPEVKRNIQEFTATRMELVQYIGSEDLSKRYTSVRTAAAAIGKLNDYEKSMKLFSKWAHPTAVAVMLGQPSADTLNAVRINMTRSALTMATEACKMGLTCSDELKRKVAQTGN